MLSLLSCNKVPTGRQKGKFILSDELQNILSGKGQVSHGTFIQTIARYLRAGPSTGPMAQEDQHDKHQETEKLTAYVERHGYWVKNINFSDSIPERAKQRAAYEQRGRMPFITSKHTNLEVTYRQNLTINESRAILVL